MAYKQCTICDKAEAAHRAGAKHLYPIWSVHCDECCRRVLSFYPEHELASMNMALIVGMKRGFSFVTEMQRRMRDEFLQAITPSDDVDLDILDLPDEDTAPCSRPAAVGAGGWPVFGFNESYLKSRGVDAIRQYKQSSSGRRVAR